ncbi:aluminum-activated malate transporter 2-like [Coffea eugenioides]|uniref:Aluminum-activated malate transporter 2 n=1 Tax=Coffea arabica TaxID=13443 RepID=A0A6P6SBW0_COFAR|nr:aluminum-activated malate transporter 2-like [Coffea arabica]XP_027173072.1 aluminum-activated malate transporter 2-like [Coffea eugenioides]
MEMGSGNNEKAGILTRGWRWVKDLPKNSFAKGVEIARQTKKIGQDDPRRVIHSLKLGLALTLVSLFYYFQPLYKNFGVSAMWAVMTVVVVFEFSVGATIGKGLNRGLATFIAGALGVGAHYLASMTGKVGEPIFIGLFVFLQAAVTTFIRFFPKVKARYDYGLVIFILTFSLVSISGFRTDEILDLAHKRLSTIFVGASTCVIVSIFVCPVWAGEDLHNLVADHLEKLGNFLEGFGEEYFAGSVEAEFKDNKSFLVGYKSVLNSKTTEENQANLARWEPGHGKFMYLHPWEQYLKIGALTRKCACRIEALNSYLNSEIKAPEEVFQKVQEICTIMSKESGQALKELSLAIRTMTKPSSPNRHIVNSTTAAQNLESLLKSGSWEGINLRQLISVAAVASLLIDIVISVEDIAESVTELATLAKFQSPELNVPESKIPSNAGISTKQLQVQDCPRVIISINLTPATHEVHQSQFQDSNQEAKQNVQV